MNWRIHPIEQLGESTSRPDFLSVKSRAVFLLRPRRSDKWRLMKSRCRPETTRFHWKKGFLQPEDRIPVQSRI